MGGEGVDPGVIAKVRTWKDKRFMDVTPPGSEHPMMYTTRRQLRRHETGKQAGADEKVLVLVVPEGAMVRITTGENPADSGSEESWKRIDLKRDVMLWAHEQKSHPRIVDTIANVRRLAWFPELIGYVRKHLDACGFCLSRQQAEVTVGMGIESLRRAAVMQMDHRKMTGAEMEAISGEYCSVLTMCDVATRKVVYTPVDSESAMETAITIITEWIPDFGIPEIIISDPGSGFASEVMRYIYQLLGVRDRQVKERDAKGAVSVVEAKHRVLNTVLADGFANGQITDGKKFKIFVKFAQIRETQTAKAGHVSQYELWCGQAPNTVESLITATAGGCCSAREHIIRVIWRWRRW